MSGALVIDPNDLIEAVAKGLDNGDAPANAVKFGVFTRGKVFRDVAGKLKLAGFSVLDIVGLVGLVLDLYGQYGGMIEDIVTDIVAKIRAKFGK